MSVAKKVMEGINKLVAGDAEGASEQAMIAVDAIANKTYKKLKYNEERFRKFVHRNLDVITRIMNVGVLVDGGTLRLNCNSPKMTPSPDGCYPIEAIVYHVRNKQIHAGGPPGNIEFTERLALGGSDPFLLPESLILGLLVAVVLAPENRLMHLSPGYTLGVCGKVARLNDYCGDKGKFLAWFDSARNE